MAEIKVIHIIEATTGGTRRHVVDLVRHLDRSTFSVSLLCSTRRDPDFLSDVRTLAKSGIPVHILPMTREISPWRDAAAFARIVCRLRQGRYDVVHTHSSKAGFLGRAAGRLAGVPAVIHTSHVFPFLMDVRPARKRLYLRFERLAARFTDRFICVSDDECRAARDHHLGSPNAIELIHNGVDAAEIRQAANGDARALRDELGISAGDMAIGVAGRLTLQKGHEHLVRAAAGIVLQIPAAKFLVIGDGELKAPLQGLVQRLGLAEAFRFLGKRDDIYRCLAALDLFVLPSLWEGCPYSLLEAMALEKAVVATRVGGVPEIVVPDETGLLVPPRDPGALAKAIIDLLRDPVRRKNMGVLGRMRVEERFRRSEMLSRVGQVYLQALKREQ